MLHLTLQEYAAMVQTGAFDHIDRKLELIYGEICEMNPAGPIHDDLITFLTNWSVRSCDPACTVITSQTGLDLPAQESRPEPDLMWLQKKRYANSHPQAVDVQLAIEVSYSSLAKDLEIKGELYAAAGISEYWIVDSQSRCIHVYRAPKQSSYSDRRVYVDRDSLSPLVCPTAVLNLSDLFNP